MDPFYVNAQQGEELQVDSASAYGKGRDSRTQVKEVAQSIQSCRLSGGLHPVSNNLE
jgi:hypothetical protein